MSNPIIRIHDIESGEIIDREMTKAEFDSHKKDVADFEAKQAAEKVESDKKQAILDRLGLTADEVALLIK
jgi:ribosomal protein S11